jgi:hypothetical protein
MHRSTIMLAATAVSLAAGTAVAQQALPKGYRMHKPFVQTTPAPRLTPGVVAPCRANPAIRSLTLTKVGGDPRKIQATIEVVNSSRDSWRSGPSQQNVTLTLTNGSSNRKYTVTRPLPGNAAPGAVMLRYTTPVVTDAFDTFEFSGSADVQISYDPDIAIDGNSCNDDANPADNRKQLDWRSIAPFLGNRSATSRTW